MFPKSRRRFSSTALNRAGSTVSRASVKQPLALYRVPSEMPFTTRAASASASTRSREKRFWPASRHWVLERKVAGSPLLLEEGTLRDQEKAAKPPLTRRRGGQKCV